MNFSRVIKQKGAIESLEGTPTPETEVGARAGVVSRWGRLPGGQEGLRQASEKGGSFGMGPGPVGSGPRVLARMAFFGALFILVSAFPESHQGFFARGTVVQCQGSWALCLGSPGFLVRHVIHRRVLFDPKPKPHVNESCLESFP